MQHPNNIYRILLNNEWDLDDLYQFPHAYSQIYSFVYCLDSELEVRNRVKMDDALGANPLKGGFSYVNIYSIMKKQVPSQARPRIHSLSKSSPGWLDLRLNVNVALHISASVDILLATAAEATETYRSIQKTITEIKRYRRKNRLRHIHVPEDELNILMEMAAELAGHIGFRNLDDLHARTGNAEVTLQLLLVHFRRIELAASYVQAEKVALPGREEMELGF